MINEQRNTDTPRGSESADRERGIGLGVGMGALLFATACGVTVGLLAAPEAGSRTRKRLRKRVASLRGNVREGWDDVQDRWNAAQSRVADLEERVERLAHREGDSNGGGIATITLGLAAGAGLAYLLMADDAEPVRSKAQQMASELRQRATDRWQQFRDRGTQTGAAPTSTSSSTFSDEG